MMKLRLIFALLFAKKYLLICGNEDKHVITNYTDKEICRSGNAIYL